jgi:hypothetical protein
MLRKAIITALIFSIIGCSVKLTAPKTYLNALIIPDSCDIELIRLIAEADILAIDSICDESVPIDIESLNTACNYCSKKVHRDKSSNSKFWLSTKKWKDIKTDSILVWHLYEFDTKNNDSVIGVVCRSSEASQCESFEEVKFIISTLYIYPESSKTVLGNDLE